MYVCSSHTADIMDQPGNKVANPAPGQLNREIDIFLSPFSPEKLDSRNGFSRPIPRQPAHSTHSVRPNLVLTHEIPPYFRGSVHLFKPPYAIGPVPNLSGQAVVAYRWRSLPRVRRHRASSPQGSSRNNGCCLKRSQWTNQCVPLFSHGSHYRTNEYSFCLRMSFYRVRQSRVVKVFIVYSSIASLCMYVCIGGGRTSIDYNIVKCCQIFAVLCSLSYESAVPSHHGSRGCHLHLHLRKGAGGRGGMENTVKVFLLNKCLEWLRR